ncbi:hypothetical protein, partial [Aeromonas veronii]|uniref:hypothetical protein n=1 Tax=Aeromonas veronii TaxID=654 RepID=UPI003D190759
SGISAQSGITTLSGKKCLDLWGQIQQFSPSGKDTGIGLLPDLILLDPHDGPIQDLQHPLGGYSGFLINGTTDETMDLQDFSS